MARSQEKRGVIRMKQKKRLLTRKQSRAIFIFLMLLWPVTHFVISWGINLSMIPMAFRTYGDSIAGEFVGWDRLLSNFEGIINLYKGEHKVYSEWIALRNTLSLYALVLFVNIPLSLTFAYLIYSKVPGWRMWQTLLYLPMIISAIVLVLVFRSFLLGGPFNTILNFLNLGDKIPYEGWLGPDTAWISIIIFSIWTGISSYLVYYLAAMRRIPDEFIEAARMDGATEYQIFFKIVFPLMLPSFANLTLLNVAELIGWSMPAFLMMDSMEGINGTGTIGLSLLNWSNSRIFGTAAAYGILVSAVFAPILMTVRKIVNKVTDTIQF